MRSFLQLCLIILTVSTCQALPKTPSLSDYAIIPAASSKKTAAEIEQYHLNKPYVKWLVGGASDVTPTGPFRWFRPSDSRRVRGLAAWLLIWNSIALLDAIRFTFMPRANLDMYLIGEWGPHALAQTRMLANCQLGLIATVALVGFTADEATLKNMFKILILTTLGAFRAISAGVLEGTIKAPWKVGYAAVMSAPPLLLLGYFAFVY